MFKLTRKIEYALIVLKYIGEKETNRPYSAREICDKFNIPFDTTAKVMQNMNNAGILSSSKGIKGGYSLARDLKKISYLQLFESIEGKGPDLYCESIKGDICQFHGNCNVVTPINRLNQSLKGFLSLLTLDQLLFEEGPQKVMGSL